MMVDRVQLSPPLLLIPCCQPERSKLCLQEIVIVFRVAQEIDITS